jgi:hypothetical protein
MNFLARLCWITSPLYLLVGMVFGIWMSATGDHTLAPAHAHLNLIGGVLMALFGTFYALRPVAAATRTAMVQVALAHLSAITMFPGIIMAISGMGEGLAKIASILGILTMLLFVYIVMRATAPSSS